MVITIDEVESLSCLDPDPSRPKPRERMGDLIAQSSGDDMIEYTAGSRMGRSVRLNSQHFGLILEEMRIPLVIA